MGINQAILVGVVDDLPRTEDSVCRNCDSPLLCPWRPADHWRKASWPPPTKPICSRINIACFAVHLVENSYQLNPANVVSLI